MVMSEHYGKDWLVTGGSGSIGTHVVEEILMSYSPSRLRVLSNSEYELWNLQYRLEERFPSESISPVRYLLKDITDYDALKEAVRGVDYIIHCAALKHVKSCEYNPESAKKVNIDGTLNLIFTTLDSDVERVVNISSDKACMPHCLMGMTKAIGERLMVWASKYRPASERHPIYANVRFGNVFGSSGSVVEKWFKSSRIDVSDSRMRRFFMQPEDAVGLILKAMFMAKGGETFVMKMPVVNIMTLAEVFVHLYGKKIFVTKAGVGEKLDEILVSVDESVRCREDGEFFVIGGDITGQEPFEYSTVTEGVSGKGLLSFSELVSMVIDYGDKSRL